MIGRNRLTKTQGETLRRLATLPLRAETRPDPDPGVRWLRTMQALQTRGLVALMKDGDRWAARITNGGVRRLLVKAKNARKGIRPYRESVEHVALNDEPTCQDHGEVASMISTDVLAFVYRKTAEQVAEDIVAVRLKEDRAE